MGNNTNYSKDHDTLENFNVNDKYSVTGESEFSRDSTIPFDQDEVLSERHYNLGDHSYRGRQIVKVREKGPQQATSSFKGKGPKGYRRSDNLIKEDVCEALYRSTEVDASEIEVTVEEGVVHLKGFVVSREQKKMAESAIENLTGIADVYNELNIAPKNKNAPLGKRGLMNNITGMN
ncbi:MAG: BON domain-containing protein [Bacteriovoracaceae bacterium]|nr:BON domain-containing protein [Bacteriovoracaceae bacterium]